ncbi:MAG: hypothetical protein IKI20_04085 [Lachnospiraceae bacterium]|nr:hypothetical protein [Lachnospiraceae bacterium]MBR6297921.1 hypothetical protein [Candidatus Gastranaerophilales bacterium]
MKNRIRQRSNRRIKEEILDLKNSCGFYDPTPYEAVKQIIKEERELQKKLKRELKKQR